MTSRAAKLLDTGARRGAGILGLAVGLALVFWVPIGCHFRPRPARPNILLISLDACRADHLSCYGHGRPTSPFLDSLASGGVRFSNAFVNTLGTTPSHATLLSSQYQQTHRMEFGYGEYETPFDTVPAGLTMLQEILSGHGYLTIGVVEGGRLSSGFGFDRGFSLFDEQGGDVRSRTAKLVSLIGSGGDRKKPIFALFHTAEIHSPYQPPEDYRNLFGRTDSDFVASNENMIDAIYGRRPFPTKDDLARLEELYDGEIRYTDDNLRRMFRQLEETGFLDNCLVVVTADHGEEFGEHGGLLHRGLLYDEFIHVPLILWGKRVPSGKVSEEMVSSVDVAPTILRFAGLEPTVDMQGRNLLEPVDPSGDDFILAQFRDIRYAVRTREWKLIASTDPSRFELFDVRADPREQVNLATVRRDVVKALGNRIRDGLLGKAVLEGGRTITPGAEQLERLKSLGYIGGAETPGENPPKAVKPPRR